MERIFVSLGSNLGDRLAQLRAALAELAQVAQLRAVSDVYETEPVENTAQPWFLNAVAELELSAAAEPGADAPQRLLEQMLAIERRMGRRREETTRKGPRPIDLDLLLYGERVVEAAGLVLPHPAMQERRFVLEPLAQIAPEVVHPVLHRSAQELLALLRRGGGEVRRLGALPAAD